MSSYDQPDKASKFAPSDHPDWPGRLFLIWPISSEVVVFTDPKTGQPEPTDIVTADVAIIDLLDQETQRPVFLENARIGGKAMTPQLKTRLGRKVLGRLTMGQKQPGKNPAFFVSDFTPQDAQLAEQYESVFPRVTYDSAGGGAAVPQTPAWAGAAPAQAQPAPAAPAVPQTPTWGQPAPAAPAVPQTPTWGQPAPAAAPPVAAPVAPAAVLTGAQVLALLQSKGIPTDGMSEEVARQIAATF